MVPQIMKLGCPKTGTGGRRLTLPCRIALRSIADFHFENWRSVRLAGSTRLMASIRDALELPTNVAAQPRGHTCVG